MRIANAGAARAVSLSAPETHDTPASLSPDAGPLFTPSTHVALSEAALSRLHEEAVERGQAMDGDSAAGLQAVLAARRQDADRMPDLGSTLFTDPFTAVDAGIVTPLFAMADSRVDHSGTTLAEALHDAMSSPVSDGTDSTQNAADLAMKKARLEAIKTQYMNPARQQDAQGVIDRYIDTLAARQDRLTTALWQTDQTLALSLGDTGRAARDASALRDMAQGTDTTQAERRAALDIVAGGTPTEATFAALKRLFTGPDAERDARYVDRLAEQWQDFRQKYLTTQ